MYNGPVNQNPIQMIEQFKSFCQNFKGNPQEEVMKMLQSGRLNQNQLNQIQSMASRFQKILSGNK